MNIFAKENYFVFQKHKYGPYALAIDIIGRDIGEYQSYYGIKDTETTYNMVYQTICSEKTTRVLERLLPAVEKAVKYINQIAEDHDLEGISTVLFLIEEKSGKIEDQLIQDFKDWSEDKASRFLEKEIRRYIDILEKTKLVEKDILGGYTVTGSADVFLEQN